MIYANFDQVDALNLLTVHSNSYINIEYAVYFVHKLAASQSLVAEILRTSDCISICKLPQ